jgi:hypothetical protein
MKGGGRQRKPHQGATRLPPHKCRGQREKLRVTKDQPFQHQSSDLAWPDLLPSHIIYQSQDNSNNNNDNVLRFLMNIQLQLL